MPAHRLLPTLDTLEEMEFRTLGDFNQGSAGVLWCRAGTSPWARHPDDDELPYVLEGEAVIRVLTEEGPVDTMVRVASMCVVPRGPWHCHQVPELLKEFHVTQGATAHSTADDRRTAS